MFDFYRIVGPESSKQENFSSLCSHLIMKKFPTARAIEGKGGDEGVDTIIGEFNGPCHVFQHKYFIDRIGPSQRKQIVSSFETACKHHDVKKWTLMIPKDFNPSELRWFQEFQRKYTSIEIDYLGKTQLQSMLTEFPEISREYEPSPVIKLFLVDKQLNLQEVALDKFTSILKEATGITVYPHIAENAITYAARDLIRRSKLRILIFGPGSSGGEIYKKRCEIRDQLLRMGHQPDFAEDVWTPQKLEVSGLNLTVAEYIQAKSYDYIICLMASPGSIGEVHDFAKDKSLACKMLICVDESHKGGYSAQGVLRIFEGHNGKIDWYENPQDIQKCYLSGRILQQIQNVTEAKQWEMAKGDSI